MVFLLIGILQGIGAYYAKNLKSYIKPIYSKFLHNLSAVICFIVGMVSLIYGYLGGMMVPYSTDEIRFCLIVFAIITIILSLIGTIKTTFQQFKTVVPSRFLRS